jgi:phosphoribosyl 1,2-cyclic phosphodiesterase
MQLASDRSDDLKRRIMGGKGHLSNEESARAVARIEPREMVVLLHLSRQCNHPDRALEVHARPGPSVMVSHHDRPGEWVGVVDPAKHVVPQVQAVRPAATLWEA